MKAKGLHEGYIEQIQRLFEDRLYANAPIPTDAEGRIRIDDWEMRDDVQAEVAALWSNADSENIVAISDLAGYRADFLNLFGFDVAGVDYQADANEMVQVPGLVG